MDLVGGLSAGVVTLALIAFLILLAILWTLLPFAMFGIKPLLRDLIAENRRTNALLQALMDDEKQKRAAETHWIEPTSAQDSSLTAFGTPKTLYRPPRGDVK